MQRNLAWPSDAYWFAPVGAVAAGGAAPVVALGCAGCGACVCCCVGNSVGCAVVALPARQSATKALSVMPLAWFASLFACHSCVHSLTVLCCAKAGADTSIAPITAPTTTIVRIFNS